MLNEFFKIVPNPDFASFTKQDKINYNAMQQELINISYFYFGCAIIVLADIFWHAVFKGE